MSQADSAAPRPARRVVMPARKLARASIGLGVTTAWLALLGVVTTPFMIHHLGVARYGIFALITIVSQYLSNLEFGFGYATSRFLARARAAEDPEAERAVVTTSYAIFLVAGLAGTAIGFFAAPFVTHNFVHPASLRPTAFVAIRLGMVILFMSVLSSFAIVSLQALGRFQAVVGIRLVGGTMVSVSAVSVVALGGHLTAVLVAGCVCATAGCVVLMAILAREVHGSLWPRIHVPTLRTMAGYGLVIFANGLIFQVLFQAPPTILARYSTTTQVAAFAVPNVILQQLVGVATSTSLAFLPFASAASVDADRSHLSRIYRANLRLTLLVIAPAAMYLIFFGRTLLTTWIGTGFAARATAPLAFLSAASILIALSAPPADVVRGLGRPGWVVRYTAASAVLVVVIALLVVPGHGAGGAAFAFMCGLAVTTLPFVFGVATVFLQVGPGTLARSLARPIAAVAFLAAIFALASGFSSRFVVAVVAGALGSALYLLLCFTAVLDDDERTALRGVYRRRRGREAPPPATPVQPPPTALVGAGGGSESPP